MFPSREKRGCYAGPLRALESAARRVTRQLVSWSSNRRVPGWRRFQWRRPDRVQIHLYMMQFHRVGVPRGKSRLAGADNIRQTEAGDSHLGQPVNIDHLLSAIYGDTTDRDIPKYGRALRDGLLFGLVDSSRFVRISDSYIDTGDDGIVIKSGALRAQAPEA